MNQLDIFTCNGGPNYGPESRTVLVSARSFSKVYHNSTQLKGQELSAEQTRASKQVEIILKVFQDHPHTSFTPYNIFYHLGQQFDRNSIRRAITDLTTAGYLVKSAKADKVSPLGRKNHTWKLKPDQNHHSI